MNIYDVVSHLILKLKNKTLLRINNLGHMAQNWNFNFDSNLSFSQLHLLLYISIHQLESSQCIISQIEQT